MKKSDLILIGALLALSFAALLLLPGSRGGTALVRTPEAEIILPLDADGEHLIQSALGCNTVRIKNGKISVISADCPDLCCIQAGEIDREGEMIVCLPNQMLVRIEGGAKGEVDAVVG